MEQLVQLTKELLQLNEEALSQYEKVRKTGQKGDFYQEVKPFADKVKEKNDLWKEKMLEWVAKHKPKQLFPLQINNTSENIEMTSVQCFFPESSYNRFISHHQSIKFILETTLIALQQVSINNK